MNGNENENKNKGKFKYEITIDGKKVTKFVAPEKNEEFLKRYKNNNIVTLFNPEFSQEAFEKILKTDEPGKQESSSTEVSTEQIIETDPSQKTQPINTEFNLEDTSSELHLYDADGDGEFNNLDNEFQLYDADNDIDEITSGAKLEYHTGIEDVDYNPLGLKHFDAVKSAIINQFNLNPDATDLEIESFINEKTVNAEKVGYSYRKDLLSDLFRKKRNKRNPEVDGNGRTIILGGKSCPVKSVTPM